MTATAQGLGYRPGARSATDSPRWPNVTVSRTCTSDVYVFGSRAAEVAARVRGARHVPPGPSGSDLDVGARPLAGALTGPAERVDVALALEDLFGVERVDLVVLPEAGEFLALAAISGELICCADSTDQAEYELYVLRRAGDLLPFERERR